MKKQILNFKTKKITKATILSLIAVISLSSCLFPNETTQSVNITNEIELPKPPVKVEAVKVFPTSSSLNVGDKTSIVATVNFSNGVTDNDILWVSSNPSIVQVDQKGEVTALQEGSAIISAVSRKDADKVSGISILVNPNGTKVTEQKKPPTIVSSVVIKPASISMKVEDNVDLYGTVFYSDASSNQKVIWRSLNTSIARVDSTGRVFAVGEGQVKIEAVALDDNQKTTEATIVIVKANQDKNKPLVTPTPIVTPIPIPTPTPTPTPVITPTPTPLPPIPTPTPTNIPSTPPTETPIPSSSIIPTNSPTPTSSEIPVNSTFAIDSKIVFTALDQISIMSGTSGNIRTLTVSGKYPVWSPDGSKIAYSSNSEIYIIDVNSFVITQLTNNTFIDDLASWSPDGSKLAFASTRDGNFEIYTMDIDGKNQKRITNNDVTDFFPSWSPDGSKIAYSSNGSICTMNIDGSNYKVLTQGSPYSSWSPDGSKIAYTNNNNIYIMNADGTTSLQLTNTVSDYYPSWSPDGSKITFASNRDGSMKIYVMNSDGKNQIKITNKSLFDYHPNWSKR